VTSGYGIGCDLFQIKTSGGKFEADEIYSNNVMVNHHGGVVLDREHVYGYSDGKGWVCQNFKSGEMIWEEERKLEKGALVWADDLLILRSESGPGTVALIEATPSGYHEKGRFNPPERSRESSWAHPVVIGGKLYLRDQDVLLCYEVKAKD
jgi:hypothetical protein